MSQATISAMMRAIAPTIRDYLSDAVRPLHARLVALESRPAAKDGEPGSPGKDADVARLDAVERAVEAVAAATAELAQRSPPEAKEPTPEALQAAVARHFEANPAPAGEPGKNAEPVTPAEIADAVAKFFVAHPTEPAKNGKDADPVTPEQLDDAAARYFKANPPKDGVSVKGDEGRGVRELLIDADGGLVATFTDGTVKAVGIVKGADGKSVDPSEVAELRRLVTEQKAVAPAAEPTDLTVPDDVCELVSKAAAILAEPPPQIDRSSQPLVVNVGAGHRPQKGPTRKTMTITHDDKGQPVFEIIEREVA